MNKGFKGLGLREAGVLDCLAGRKMAMAELAAALGVKAPNLSIYVKHLEGLGLVRVERDGQRKIVSLDSGVAFEFSSLKTAFPSLSFQDVLGGRTPLLLAFLVDKNTLRLREIDLPAVTAKRLLVRLRGIGLVSMPRRGVYSLRREALSVARFCRMVLTRVLFSGAQAELGLVERVVCSFDSAREARGIFVALEKRVSGRFWLTGLSVAHEYGLYLIPAGRFYYADAKPGLADVIIHSLAFSNDSRGILYAAALLKKNKFSPRRLLLRRRLFGLDRRYLRGFVDFVESRGESSFGGFDSFAEVEALLK